MGICIFTPFTNHFLIPPLLLPLAHYQQPSVRHPEEFGAVNTVEGFDAVGEIVGIGPETERFKVGEKVMTFARGIGPGMLESSGVLLNGIVSMICLHLPTVEWGASQEFFLALAATCWAFDETKLSEIQAATIPLTLFTACDGLYNRLEPPLPLPWEIGCGTPILLWGASSQVGIQAIQFAKFSGCHPIIATASPKVRNPPLLRENLRQTANRHWTDTKVAT